MEFGEKLREVRKVKRMSMRELEERSGISHSYISQLETGNRAVPRPDTLRKLAKGLNVSLTMLLEKAGYLRADDFRGEKIVDREKEIFLDHLVERFHSAQKLMQITGQKDREHLILQLEARRDLDTLTSLINYLPAEEKTYVDNELAWKRELR